MVNNFLKIGFDILSRISLFIAPPTCFACRSFIEKDSSLCLDCESSILPVAPKLLKFNSHTINVHSVAKYDGPLRSLILAKHSSDQMTYRFLGDLIWDRTVLKYLDFDCIIPIPLHWSRKLKRGFNQADILAERISVHSGVKVLKVATRIKKTKFQATLDKLNRFENVDKAFIIDPDTNLKGKNIMIVDDLCTTGSTSIAMAKVLLRFKPASISLVTVCRA